MKIRGVVDVSSAFNAMCRVADAEGVTFTQQDDCTQPCADLETRRVILPTINAFSTEHELKMWKGYGYHEAGHLDSALSDLSTLMASKSIGFNSLLGRIINVGEDIRNERNKHGVYPGRDQALEYTQDWHCADGAKQLKQAQDNGQDFEEDLVLFTKALLLGYIYRGETFQPLLKATAIYWDEIAMSDCSDFYHLMTDMEFVTAQDVYDWAIKFLVENGKTEEEVVQEAQEAYQKQQSQEGEEGEGADGEEAEGDPDEDGEGGPAKVSYKDLMSDNHESKEERTGQRVVIDYDHDERDNFEPGPFAGEFKLGETDWHVSENVEEHFKNASKLSSKVKRLFQAASQRQKIGSQREGPLDKRALWKVPTGSKEVFYKLDRRIDPKSTAVYVLCDGSGSMTWNERFEKAGAAGAAIVDSLGVLQMPLKLAIFSDQSRGRRHAIVKGWNEKATPKQVAQRFGYFAREGYMSCNDDGSSILTCAKDLASRPEPRKLLIVLSDGQPAAAGWGDCYTWTKKVVQCVSASGIECYGIGIEDDAVASIYPEYTVLSDVSNLDATLLNVIKSKLL